MSNTEHKINDPFQNPFEKQLDDTIFTSGKSRDANISVTEDVIVREPIVKKVLDKPIVEEIKDVKNVSIVHKDVVQEIHQQPIIEIAKKKEVVHITEMPFIQKTQAPTKYEEIKNFDFAGTPDLGLNKPVQHIEEVGDVKHVDLGEDVRAVSRQDFIERHIIPTVTEVREQKVINVIEQPIVRKITEKPVIREVEIEGDVTTLEKFRSSQAPSALPLTQPAVLSAPMRDSSMERERQLPSVQESTHLLTKGKEQFTSASVEAPMRDSTLERENQLPPVQESTHVLLKEQLHGPFSEEKFEGEISRGKAALHDAHPLSSTAFKDEIKFGQDVLHTARPFAAEGFTLQLQERKSTLTKSRYFSKPTFIPEFMAQKKLLKPVEGNIYSEELSKLGSWKSDSYVRHALESAGGFLWNAYESVSHKVADTYENLKDKVLPEKM